MAYGNGVIVASIHPNIVQDGYCISQDFGENWTHHVGLPHLAALVFNGSQFLGYAHGKLLTSIDGTNWTETNATYDGQTRGIRIGAVGFSPDTGDYVAFYGSYENAEYFVSRNGINWISVDSSSGNVPVNPHRITHVISGRLPIESCE